MNHENKARELFRAGYNCSQAVLLAFSDVTGLDEKTAVTLSSSFGGGMGRLREVCGAVSGAFMVAGILRGYSDPTDHEAKKEHYALIQRIAQEFKKITAPISAASSSSSLRVPPIPSPKRELKLTTTAAAARTT